MTLDVKFEEITGAFAVDIEETTQAFGVDMGEVQHVTEFIGGEEYKGEYIATPTTKEQLFETKGKVMLDNITVKKIPFFNVSNANGGNTVYIASEV